MTTTYSGGSGSDHNSEADEKRKTQVADQMGKLDDEIAALAGAVEVFELLLASILSNDPVESQGEGGEVPTLCKLAMDIRAFRYRVAKLADVLSVTAGRVEL